MNRDTPDEFIELFESLCEGALDEPGHERLVAMLRENPDLLDEVRGHLEVGGLLTGMTAAEDAEDDFADRTAAHVVKIAAEAEDSFPRRVTRRIVRRRVAFGLAVAAMAALALLPLLFRQDGGSKPATAGAADPQPPAVARLERMDASGEIIGHGTVRAGGRLVEDAGWIRLEFANGAVIAVEAPADLTVVSGMEVALGRGRLNGWCPESAHGFRVTTASASLTDLGTSFGVNASAGRAKFMVLDGRVEVEKGEDKRQLAMGDAVETTLAEPLRDIVFDPSGFHKTWALSHGILATRGALMPVRPDVPEKLVSVEDDHHVLVIPERRDVRFEQPIRAEIIKPGTLPGDFDGRLHVLEPQPGKRLGSYLIRYNPVGVFSEEHFLEFEGEVTFDRPVVAIACKIDALEATDPAFTIGEWGGIYRGIEIEQHLNPPDTVTLSEDRRTVHVRFYAGVSTDDVRVIVEEE